MRSLINVSAVALLAAGVATPAIAQDEGGGMSPFSSIDAYLMHSTIDNDTSATGIDDSEIGAGMRLRLGLGDWIFLSGGFQSVRVNNPELQNGNTGQGDQTRRFREQYFEGGLRYGFGERDTVTVFATVGDFRAKWSGDVVVGSASEDGSGLIYGGGVQWAVVPGFQVNASYRRSDEFDAGDFDEITAGGALQISNSFALVAEYRMAGFEIEDSENGGDLQFDDIRLGMRFSFQGAQSDSFY